MHEMGVALEIARLAERHVGRANAARLSRVALVVGDDAAVERASLELCLSAVLASPPFAGAVVTIAPAPGDALRVDYLEIDDERPCH